MAPKRPRARPLSPLSLLLLMEGSPSTPIASSSLRDEGLLALMRAFPPDILSNVVLSFLCISDEKVLWEEESAFRTVYTWCMATHREAGLRRRKEGMWPLIRSTVAVFSQRGLDWTDKVAPSTTTGVGADRSRLAELCATSGTW